MPMSRNKLYIQRGHRSGLATHKVHPYQKAFVPYMELRFEECEQDVDAYNIALMRML